MKRILNNHGRDMERRKDLKKKLKGVSKFLKYSYITHLSESSYDPLHNFKFGLDHETFPDGKFTSTCAESNDVFSFVEKIKEPIIGMITSIKNIGGRRLSLRR